MGTPTLPNLIIVGFPKCGTHALLHNLDLHPEIHTHPDEVSFFGRSDGRGDDFVRLFDSDYRYNGQKNPLYVLHPKAMAHMAELVPDARLIVCLRHPIQFIHSYYNFRVWEFEHGFAAGVDPGQCSFDELALEEREIKWMSIHQGCYIRHIQ
jgi:hypothetical protein